MTHVPTKSGLTHNLTHAPTKSGLTHDMKDKVKIREKLLKWRRNLPESEREEKDRRIRHRLENLDIFKSAQHILFYYSVNGEADTHKLIENHLENKQLYLPVITDSSKFQAIPLSSPLNLKRGFEKVPEPIGIEPSSTYDQSVEIIVVPGVAFDLKGDRLGMGKGYYDRYLQRQKGKLKIGLAYAEQILDSIPKDNYDEPVDIIITDRAVYDCR